MFLYFFVIARLTLRDVWTPVANQTQKESSKQYIRPLKRFNRKHVVEYLDILVNIDEQHLP